MREFRPRLNEAEIRLLIEALEKAEYHKRVGTDKWEIYRRFELMLFSTFVRTRIY